MSSNSNVAQLFYFMIAIRKYSSCIHQCTCKASCRCLHKAWESRNLDFPVPCMREVELVLASWEMILDVAVRVYTRPGMYCDILQCLPRVLASYFCSTAAIQAFPALAKRLQWINRTEYLCTFDWRGDPFAWPPTVGIQIVRLPLHLSRQESDYSPE
jgi:hypothetical protein